NTLWARTAAGVPDGNTVHMIDISYPTGNNGTVVNGLNGCLSYSRSLDGGQNWDILRVIPPDIDSTTYSGFRADAYAMDAKDNTVAFVSGNLIDDWALWKSTDNGSTWTRSVILDFPFTKYDDVTQTTDVDGDGVADTLLTTDGAYAILIDNNGMVHAFAGAMLILDDDPAANLGLFLSTDGLLYWNESFGSNEPVVIATAPDIDLDGVASSFATNLGGRYGNDGICSMPSAAIDAAGNIYLSYCPLIELTDNAQPDPNNFSFRNVLLMASTDNGATWGTPANISNSNFDEAVFCALAKNVDNCVSMIWQQDGAPGYSVPPNGQHAIQSNDIVYDCIDPNLVLGLNGSIADAVKSVNVFPNPANDQLTISIQNDGFKAGVVEIRNIMGQAVWSNTLLDVAAGVLRLDVDVKTLPNGMYTVSIADDQSASTVKFVKN
ncbi:MAG: T9SS type A sorting domain-containing protein, partial [Bacteroidia bacterium]